MEEPDFDVKMLSKNGIDVPQFSGKEHFMLTRVRDKDCVKNRVKRAKIVRFTLC